MSILALILSAGLGFGLPTMIFGILLSKTNDMGNSIGQASSYTTGIEYDIVWDDIGADGAEHFAEGYITDDDRNMKEPEDNLPVCIRGEI